jgi:endonuclease YncB( thermonuclease family)
MNAGSTTAKRGTPVTVWTVPATIERVVDADTVAMVLDLGWRITYRANARILGVNAPELSTTEGREARDWARGLLPAGTAVTFRSESLDKYGRPLGALTLPDGRDYATALLDAGHAVPYSP